MCVCLPQRSSLSIIFMKQKLLLSMFEGIKVIALFFTKFWIQMLQLFKTNKPRSYMSDSRDIMSVNVLNVQTLESTIKHKNTVQVFFFFWRLARGKCCLFKRHPEHVISSHAPHTSSQTLENNTDNHTWPLPPQVPLNFSCWLLLIKVFLSLYYR